MEDELLELSRQVRCLCTCQDAQGDVEVFQAGSEGAEDEASGRQQASQHHCSSAREMVAKETSHRS